MPRTPGLRETVDALAWRSYAITSEHWGGVTIAHR